jgi:hypothetical protein
MADKVAKGRQARTGAKVHWSKLSEDDVIDIRTVAAFGGTPAGIAAAYGVAQQTIADALSRRTWNRLP